MGDEIFYGGKGVCAQKPRLTGMAWPDLLTIDAVMFGGPVSLSAHGPLQVTLPHLHMAGAWSQHLIEV